MPPRTTLTRAEFDEYLLRSFIRFLQTGLGNSYRVVHWMPELLPANALADTFADATKKAVVAVALTDAQHKKVRSRYGHFVSGTTKQVATGETLFGEFLLTIAGRTNEGPNSGLRDVLRCLGTLKGVLAAQDSTPVRDFDASGGAGSDTSLKITWNFDDNRTAPTFRTLPVVASEYQNASATIPFWCDFYVLEDQAVVTSRSLVPDKRAS
jgi:hypothetical protein